MRLEVGQGGIAIDSRDLGPLLGLSAADVCDRLKSGEITGAVETGRAGGEDAFRVTYRHRGLRIAFILDGTGEVIGLQRTIARLN